MRARIIATVNEPPEELMAQGKLRKDLYYRLNVVNLWIPALRERPDDIPALAEAFLHKHNKRFGKQLWAISEEAIVKLKQYDYPGNARELENLIEQAVSMADKEHVLSDKMLAMPSFGRRAHLSLIHICGSSASTRAVTRAPLLMSRLVRVFPKNPVAPVIR